MPSDRVELFDMRLAGFDPPAALRRLCKDEGSGYGFSIEKRDGADDAVYLGVAPVEIARVRAGRVWVTSGRARPRALPEPPFEALGRRLEARRASAPEPFLCGAVGWLGYGMIRHLEPSPVRSTAEEGCLMFYDEVIRWDRRRMKVELAARVRGRADRSRAAERARIWGQRLLLSAAERRPRPVPDGPQAPAALERPMLGRERFLEGVRRLKEHIRAGDIFQAVLSERFTVAGAPPGDFYRALRRTNPAPFVYCVRDGIRQLVGASPERLVRVLGGAALNCPIAGTRPRGKTPAEDRRLERALRASAKERAEHLMLVDLARNDLGRVCAPGTVKVRELMALKRYPNVMHLVSEVAGRLERGVNAWQALAASFPAGTVSGAPKLRAIELLGGLEPEPRGFYAGAVVQHDSTGNLDSWIAIRTAELLGDRAVLQAGAGIVADSRPEAEYEEVQSKLLGLRWALSEARRA